MSQLGNPTASLSIDKIVPVTFVMARSGTYQEQHIRTWQMDAGMNVLNNLSNHILQNASTAVNDKLISTVAPDMLQVSAGHTGSVPIVNGWNTTRGVFVLMIDVYYKIGTIVRWIVQGYTDEAAFTDQSIAPGCIFFINNVLALAPRTVQHNGVTMTGMTLTDNFQMVNGFTSQMNGGTGNLLLRPQDVMSQISMNDFMSTVPVVTDLTSAAGSAPQTSRHSNNIGSSILANTFNVWHQAASMEHTSATVGAIAEKAYALVLESDPAETVFMNILTSANRSIGNSASSFTFNQLLKAVPNVMSLYHTVQSSGVGVTFSSSADSQHFAGQTHATKVAVNLGTVVPALMVESLLSLVGFSMNNHQIGGGVDVRPLAANAFSRETDTMQWEVFKTRLIREVVPLIVPRGTGITFSLVCSCSFFHEFQLDITMMGETVRYVMPAFCNSLTVPVQTNSQTVAKNYATDLEVAAMHINDALMESTIRRANQVEKQTLSPGSVMAPFKLPGMGGAAQGAFTPQHAAPAATQHAMHSIPSMPSGMMGFPAGQPVQQPQPSIQPSSCGGMGSVSR